MERRLQKGFQIGLVEGIIKEVITDNKEPRDVFSKIAKAIGQSSSKKNKKKDWNAMVRRSTTVRDPIGSSTEVKVRQSRQSIRRHIISNYNNALVNMDPDQLVEYNPKLSLVTPTTRIAYAKFKAAKIRHEYEQHDSTCRKSAGSRSASISSDDVFEPNTSSASDEASKYIAVPRPKSSIKKSEDMPSIPSELSDVVGDMLVPPSGTADVSDHEKTTEPELHTSPSSVKKDFRSRTPIQEEDEEDYKAGEESVREKEENKEISTSSPNKCSITNPEGKSKATGKSLTGWL